MPVQVTPQDVADRWRPLSDDETQVASVLLDDAVDRVYGRLPLLDAWVADTLVTERTIVSVLSDVVQRVLRNPEVQASLQLGADGSLGQSFPTRAADVARPRLEVTDADLDQLIPRPVVALPTPTPPASGAYSIPLW